MTRYGYKFPNWGWDRVVYLRRARTPQAAAKTIEDIYKGTSEPFVQLIQDDGETLAVIAEYLPARRGWMTPLKAAGLE